MYYAIAGEAGFVAGVVVCWLFKGSLLAELKLAHTKLDTLLARVKGL